MFRSHSLYAWHLKLFMHFAVKSFGDILFMHGVKGHHCDPSEYHAGFGYSLLVFYNILNKRQLYDNPLNATTQSA
jgi:hypothetical protein